MLNEKKFILKTKEKIDMKLYQQQRQETVSLQDSSLELANAKYQFYSRYYHKYRIIPQYYYYQVSEESPYIF